MKTRLFFIIWLLVFKCSLYVAAQSQFAGIYGGTVNDTTFGNPDAGTFAVFVGTNGQATVVGYDVDSYNNYSGQSGGIAAQFNVPANGNWSFSSNNTIFGVSGSGSITNGSFSGTLNFTNGDTVQLNGSLQSPLGSFQNAAGYYSGTYSGNFGGPSSGPLMGVLSADGKITFSSFSNGELNDGGQGQLGANNQFITTNITSGTRVSGTLTNATLTFGGNVTNSYGSAIFTMSRSNYVFRIATTNLPAGVTTVPYNQTLTAYGGPTNYTWGIISGGLPAGLSLSSVGVISGTPTTAATTNFTVRATNALSATTTQALSLVIYGFSTNVTFSVSPAVVSNTYSGTVALQASNLISGETVVVQKYIDANTNGVIDAADSLVQQFQLTDGTAAVIGGVTNLNIPGDFNPSAGIITAQLNLQTGGILHHMVARYAWKLSSPAGRFTPVTNLFSVTNHSYSQSFTGSVRNSNTNVPNAVVMVFLPMPDFKPVAGTIANNSGDYAIKVPPGTYLLWTVKSNFVANLTTAPTLTLNSNVTISTNLFLTNANRTISGRIVDAANTNIGLPGCSLFAMSTNNLFGMGFSDTNGAFAMRVTSSQWRIMWERSVFNSLGYLTPLDSPIAVTTAGDATMGDVGFSKGTALIYGNYSDHLGHPQSGVTFSNPNDGTNRADATSDGNGGYFMPVIAGNWNLSVDAVYSGYSNLVFLPSLYGNYAMTNGDALRLDYTSYPAPFIRQPTSPSANQFSFELIGFGSSSYIVQFSTNMSATNWSTLLTTNLPYDSAFLIQDNQATNKQRFYRVKVGP